MKKLLFVAILMAGANSMAVVHKIAEGAVKVTKKVVCVPVRVFDKLTGEWMTVCKDVDDDTQPVTKN